MLVLELSTDHFTLTILPSKKIITKNNMNAYASVEHNYTEFLTKSIYQKKFQQGRGKLFRNCNEYELCFHWVF